MFGADLISGFPTETDEMFQESLAIIKECELTHLHIFPYSIRKNTPAARMPQVQKDIIKNRARTLREEGDKQMKNYLILIINLNLQLRLLIILIMKIL